MLGKEKWTGFSDKMYGVVFVRLYNQNILGQARLFISYSTIMCLAFN